MFEENKKKNTAVAKVLPLLMRDMGWEKQLDLHSIFVNWHDIVDGEIRDHAEPLKIERGVLWLEVENSSWLQQLQYHKLELMGTLNGCLKLARLKDIKMVLPKESDSRQKQKRPTKVKFVRPSAEKVAAFERQVGCIADEKCREALMQFWYLAEACKREKNNNT